MWDDKKVEGLESALAKVQGHAKTAYQRGVEMGRLSNERQTKEAVRAMELAQQATLDENARFTELLEAAERRIEELELELSGFERVRDQIAEMVECPERRWSTLLLALHDRLMK